MEHRHRRRRITAAALLRGEILVAPTGRRVGAGVALSAQATLFRALGPAGSWGAGECPLAAATAGAALATGHATLPCLSVPQRIGATASFGEVARFFYSFATSLIKLIIFNSDSVGCAEFDRKRKESGFQE